MERVRYTASEAARFNCTIDFATAAAASPQRWKLQVSLLKNNCSCKSALLRCRRHGGGHSIHANVAAVLVVDRLDTRLHLQKSLSDHRPISGECNATQACQESVPLFPARRRALIHPTIDVLPQEILAGIQVGGILGKLERGDSRRWRPSGESAIALPFERGTRFVKIWHGNSRRASR